MTIAVLGAHGKSGKIFVQHALAAGYSVKAGARGDSRLPDHKNLVQLRCDATIEADVENLIAGCDVVVSLLGHKFRSKDDLQAKAMRILTKVMPRQDVAKIISLTGTGVRFPGDKIRLIDRIVTLMLSIVDANRMRDGNDHVSVLQSSTLDWTVLRVFKLTSGTLRPFALRQQGPVAMTSSRETVADAVLEIIGQKSFGSQAPMLCKK